MPEKKRVGVNDIVVEYHQHSISMSSIVNELKIGLEAKINECEELKKIVAGLEARIDELEKPKEKIKK